VCNDISIIPVVEVVYCSSICSVTPVELDVGKDTIDTIPVFGSEGEFQLCVSGCVGPGCVDFVGVSFVISDVTSLSCVGLAVGVVDIVPFSFKGIEW
jgi:hypothetical protein